MTDKETFLVVGAIAFFIIGILGGVCMGFESRIKALEQIANPNKSRPEADFLK